MLHVFASQGNIKNVSQYLDRNPVAVEDLNYNAQSVLHVAAAYGRLELCQYLVQKQTRSAHVFSKDRWGDTPLDLALRGHFYEVALLLLNSAPASQAPAPNPPPPMPAVADARYQLFLAIASKHSELPKNAGSEEEMGKLVRAALAEGELASVDDLVDGERRTPAHLAAACGRVAVLQLLHNEFQASFVRKDRHGRIPLDEAIKFKHTACIEFLQSERAVPQLTLQELHERGVKLGWGWEERTAAFRASTEYLGEGTYFKIPCRTKPLERVALEYQGLKSNWQNEVETLARLRHPFIQHYFGACVLALPHPLLLVEDFPLTLDEVLMERGNGKPLPGEEQRRIVSQISLALFYLHTIGLIYRNLDCHHVLVYSPELCKLQLPPTQSVYEDKEYRFMAPELLRAKTRREYAPSCDVFSLGMIIYWVFSAQRPFGEERDPVKEVRLRGVMPDVRDVLDERMQPIILRCWEEDASKRFSMQELLQHIDASRAATTHPSPKSSSTIAALNNKGTRALSIRNVFKV